MRESPRVRRLRSDYRAIKQLELDSSIFSFVARRDPPESYTIRFLGKGFWRPDGSKDVLIRQQHEVLIDLSAAYPRMQPELVWQTPIFHPNISASGVVCLGGYGTYWVPGVNLDELCIMLWDMIRYANYDIASPYNRDAATWAKMQSRYDLPIDPRPLRDRLAAHQPRPVEQKPPIAGVAPSVTVPEVTFIEPEIVDAKVVERGDSDILFIE